MNGPDYGDISEDQSPDEIAEQVQRADSAWVRAGYPIGCRVRALRWGHSTIIDDNMTVPPGTEGTVDFVDGTGTVFVKWDNGKPVGRTRFA